MVSIIQPKPKKETKGTEIPTTQPTKIHKERRRKSLPRKRRTRRRHQSNVKDEIMLLQLIIFSKSNSYLYIVLFPMIFQDERLWLSTDNLGKPQSFVGLEESKVDNEARYAALGVCNLYTLDPREENFMRPNNISSTIQNLSYPLTSSSVFSKQMDTISIFFFFFFAKPKKWIQANK